MIDPSIRTFYVHPNNYAKIQKELLKEQNERVEKSAEYMIYSVEIISDPSVPEYEEIPGEWERTDVLSDDKFTSWVTDLTNPPSWAIYFGLVRLKRRMIVYGLKTTATFMTKDGVSKNTRRIRVS